MRNKLNFTMIILALLTFSSLVPAQNNEDIDKQIETTVEVLPQQRGDNSSLQRLAVRPDLDKLLADRGTCPLGLQQIIMAGINDNLAPGNDATFKSPALLAAYPTSTYSYKDFDDQSVNKLIGQSFMLKNYKPCEGKSCGGNLLVRVCNAGTDLWTNDKIYVGTIVDRKFKASVFAGGIWSSANEAKKCKDLNFPLTAAFLNSNSTLDILLQDDSSIDYMKLTLNY